MTDLGRLDDPFPEADIEWRQLRAGMASNGVWCLVAAYVTNRAIMKRLDEVCGKANWRNEYAPVALNGTEGLLCGISILTSDGWVTKWDGCVDEHSGEIDAVKMACSNSMKRAAVQWGIGRYLYQLGEVFAEIAQNNEPRGKTVKVGRTKDGKPFKWRVPKLPKWALPIVV